MKLRNFFIESSLKVNQRTKIIAYYKLNMTQLLNNFKETFLDENGGEKNV